MKSYPDGKEKIWHTGDYVVEDNAPRCSIQKDRPE